MNKIILIAISVFLLLKVDSVAQVLEIHKNIGQDTSFKIEEIDSITFNEPAIYGDSVIFFDDFESHPLYSFPYYSPWVLLNMTPDPRTLTTAIARLDNKLYASGQKSLRISTSDTEKIMVNTRLKRSPNIIYFDAKVIIEKYANVADKPAATEFGFRNIGESLSGENYASLVIKQDGIIYCKIGPTESPISPMDLNRWYRIRLMFNVPNKSLSVWFNLQPIVPKFAGFIGTFGYKDFSIISNNSDIYFDDIKIWESK